MEIFLVIDDDIILSNKSKFSGANEKFYYSRPHKFQLIKGIIIKFENNSYNNFIILRFFVDFLID
jgi:hypothetical protein